jgi:hypothetical protein
MTDNKTPRLAPDSDALELQRAFLARHPPQIDSGRTPLLTVALIAIVAFGVVAIVLGAAQELLK